MWSCKWSRLDPTSASFLWNLVKGLKLSSSHFEHYVSSFGMDASLYHTNNGIFASKEFVAASKANGQTIDYSGVCAHHQNGSAEQAANYLIDSLYHVNAFCHHWSLESGSILLLWPFAMEHPVCLWKNLPSQGNGLLPLEICCQQKASSECTICKDHMSGDVQYMS